jgi:hypothetical protein
LILWFSRRIFILCAVLAAITGILVGIARQQPADNVVTRLHLKDCKLPCWIGIVPDKTTLDEALKKILNVYGQSYDVRIDDNSAEFGEVYVSIVGPGGNRIFISLIVSSEQPYIIQTIEFLHSDLPTVPQLLETLGSPSKVKMPAPEGDPSLFYLSYGTNTYDVVLGVSPDAKTALGWNSPINSLFIADYPSPSLSECLWDHLQVQSWKGFRPPQNYLGGIGDC